MGMKFSFALLAVIIAMAGGFAWYFKLTQAKIDVLVENAAVLESVTNTQKATITELQQSQERLVKGTFQLKMYGYIIPDAIQKDLNSVKKYNSKSKLIFSMETETAPQRYEANPKSTPDGRTRENIDGEVLNSQIKDANN